MARNDVRRLRNGLVLEVQADLLDALNTRIVIPLLPRAQAPAPARILNPVFEIGAREFVLATQFLSAVTLSELGPAIGSLDAHNAEVTRALDLLYQGI